jgi:hypothetical protein
MKIRFAAFIEMLEVNSYKRHYLVALMAAIFSIALLSRLLLASKVQHPGYFDSTFYFNVAENLVDGRGAQIDWIWNYLYKPDTVTHYSYDYWMPFTSIIISIPMRIWGKSLFVALLPSILFGLMLSGVTYYFGMLYSNSGFVAFCSSILILFLPDLFQYSLVTDCVIYYVFFASLSLLCMIKGIESPKFFILASVFASFAYLTRQDGLLLMPVLLLCVLLPVHKSKNAALLTMVAALGLFLTIISPLMITNHKMLGQFFSPGSTKTFFFTDYNDFLSYSKEFTLQTFLAAGLKKVLLSKLKVAILYVQQMGDFLGGLASFLNIFALWGISQIVIPQNDQAKLRLFLPPLFFLVCLFVFYTLAATFPGLGGGFERGAMAVIPFFVVIAVEAIHRTSFSKTFILISILLITASMSYRSFEQTRSFIGTWTKIGVEYSELKEIILANINKRDTQTDITIMAESPSLVYQSTGYKAVTIPIEKEVMCDVVHKYGVNYLLAAQDRQLDETSSCEFLPVTDIPNLGLRLYSVSPDK